MINCSSQQASNNSSLCYESRDETCSQTLQEVNNEIAEFLWFWFAKYIFIAISHLCLQAEKLQSQKAWDYGHLLIWI